MTSLGAALPAPPSDGITSLNFVGKANNLLVSSWDTTVRLYQVDQAAPRGTFTHGAPVLDVASATEQISYDWEAEAEASAGVHSEPVKCLAWLPSLGLLASAGWDSQLLLWDPRAGAETPAAQISLPGKAYSMSAGEQRLVVATAGRHIHVLDLRKLATGDAVEQARESSLKHQTRCVGMYPDGSGFAAASIEGRVAMEYFDLHEAQAKRYAFKCHRASEAGRDVVYPVNALAFHRGYGTFATGGGDGVVNLWDGQHKKRLMQIAGYPTSIAVLAFNEPGTLLAVAASYTFEKGDIEHPADAIYIRPVEDAEIAPRVKVPAS